MGLGFYFKFALFLAVFISLFQAVWGYSCGGASLNWTSVNATGDCLSGSFATCEYDFQEKGVYFSSGILNIRKCETASALTAYANTSIATVVNKNYTLTFSWDGFISDSSCNNEISSGLKVEALSSSGSVIGMQEFNCSGTACNGITGYQKVDFDFTAKSEITVLRFTTSTPRAAKVTVRNIVITGDIPCQLACGGTRECVGKMPDTKISSCMEGEPYFADYCDANCGFKDLKTECMSSDFDSSCTADADCKGVAPNSCLNNTHVCSAECTYEDRDNSKAYCDNRFCSVSVWTADTCCGDDSNENVVVCKWDYGRCTGSSCCSSNSDCSMNNQCYKNNTKRVLESLACGTVAECRNGTWHETKSSSACDECGEWVESIGLCCASSDSFSFTQGACFEGLVYKCEEDGLCASVAGADCTSEDIDCRDITLNLSLSSEMIERDKKLTLNVRLINFEDSENFELTYGLYDDAGNFKDGNSITKTDVEGINNYKIDMSLSNLEPGNYSIIVETAFKGKKYSDSKNVLVQADCIDIKGLSQIYAVKDKPQDLIYTLDNTCKSNLHNISVSFLNVTSIIGDFSEQAEAELLSVGLGSTSRNAYVEVKYLEGSSKRITEINVAAESNITSIIGKLRNSTEVILEKVDGLLRYAYVGKRKEMVQNSQSAKSMINNSVIEFEKGNYGLAKDYLTSSASKLIETRKQAEKSILIEIAIGLGAILAVLLVVIVKIRNVYNQ